jgi:hypothetical protein
MIPMNFIIQTFNMVLHGSGKERTRVAGDCVLPPSRIFSTYVGHLLYVNSNNKSRRNHNILIVVGVERHVKGR